MSSLEGGNSISPMDIGLQLAPVGSDGPDFNALKYAFEDAVRNNQPYIDQ